MTGESQTEAVRRALAERRERLSFRVSPQDREAVSCSFLSAKSGLGYWKASWAAA
ncbi:MAG TPA: hypothetical protein VFB34_02765 [Chloroflexota bacterium]|nr:hypothetical protein [Chloroflexota bacterium]